MRLIDADVLLEQMKHRRDYVGRPSDPVCLVEDAPTVGGWVSVEDKLPKNEEIVIGYTPCDGYMFVGFYRTNKFSTYEWSDWQIITSMRSTKKITKKVTHWMPLPEPPKEDEKQAYTMGEADRARWIGNLYEEIADVLVCMDAVKMFLPFGAESMIEDIRKYKNERWQERLKGGNG